MELSAYSKKAIVRNLKEVNKCIKVVDVVVAGWKVMTLADDAHVNVPDEVLSSGVHVVFLADGNGSNCPLSRACDEIQRIFRSHLSVEAMTMPDSVENTLYIKEMSLDVFIGGGGAKLPIGHVTRNIFLRTVLHRNSQVKDSRLIWYHSNRK